MWFDCTPEVQDCPRSYDFGRSYQFVARNLNARRVLPALAQHPVRRCARAFGGFAARACAPVKLSALIERLGAADSHERLPKCAPSPLNGVNIVPVSFFLFFASLGFKP